MINPQTINNLNKIGRYFIVGLIILLTSALAYRMAIYPGSRMAPLLIAALAVIFILYKPIIGLAIYFVFYPLVPASGGVNLLKTGMLLLTLLILAMWAYKRLKTGTFYSVLFEYRFMYLFFAFLLFSILLSQLYGFSIMDWARDIAALLNLLLIPIMVEYLQDRKNYWLIYLVFIPVAFGIFQNGMLLLAMYGIPLANLIYLVPVRFSIFHPSWVFGLGATLYLQKVPPNRFVWLFFAIAGLMVTVLTPGRTIWITTIIITGLMLYFLSKYRKQAIILIIAAVVLIGFVAFGGMGGTTYGEKQSSRVLQFIEYQRDLSVQNRLYESEQALKLFEASPLYGVGFGFQYHFWRFITGKGYGYMDTNYTHNDIINITAKGGVVGLTLFLLMIYGFYKKLKIRRMLPDSPFIYAWATVALIILTSSIITGMSTPIFQSRSAMFGLFFILSLGLGYKPKDAD